MVEGFGVESLEAMQAYHEILVWLRDHRILPGYPLDVAQPSLAAAYHREVGCMLPNAWDRLGIYVCSPQS